MPKDKSTRTTLSFSDGTVSLSQWPVMPVPVAVTEWCLVTVSVWLLGPMIFHDRGKRTEYAEYTLWNRIAYFKVQTETSFYESKSTYFTLFFIDLNPDPVDPGICRDFDSADCGICRVYMWSWNFSVSGIHCNDVIQLNYFYFRQLFLVRDRFRCTTYLRKTLCKWAWACRNWLRTPESQHAWYSLMLVQRWLRWLGNDSTINTGMTAACALMRGWMGQHFFHQRLL